MKKVIVVFIIAFMLSCDNNTTDRNPYLPEVSF